METLSCPIHQIQESPDYPVEELEFDDTSSQTAVTGDIPKMVWQIETDTLTPSEKDALRDFFLARKAAFARFLWACPVDGVTYTCRFVPKTFKVMNVDGVNWKISFNLKRVA
jgi:phage-related protein